MADANTASLDWYFTHFKPESWDFRRFLHYYGTCQPKPTKSASKVWAQKLKAIEARSSPFESSSPIAVRRARRITRALEHHNKLRKPASTQPSSDSRSDTASNTLFSHISNSNITINLDSGTRDSSDGSKEQCRPSKEDISEAKEPTESAKRSGTPEKENARDPEVTSSPVRSSSVESGSFDATSYALPDITLSDGRTLRQLIASFVSSYGSANKDPFITELEDHIIFAYSSRFRNMLPSEADVKSCQEQLPKTPPVPKFVKECIEAWLPYINEPTRANLPQCPEGAISMEDLSTWTYIQSAVTHFVHSITIIEARGPSHGEVWADINIWGPLLDSLFLRSKTLSLDRKELQTNLPTPKKYAYDGIVRSAGIARRLDLAFLEVKPHRYPYAKSSSTDREKVLSGMKASLMAIKQTQVLDAEAMKGVVVVGIICNGMSMTVLRGWNVLGDFCFFREERYDVELCALGGILEVCWCVRMILERTYDAIVRAKNSLSSFT